MTALMVETIAASGFGVGFSAGIDFGRKTKPNWRLHRAYRIGRKPNAPVQPIPALIAQRRLVIEQGRELLDRTRAERRPHG
jgi:hypothetical protein